MNKQFTTGWLVTILVILAYFFISLLLTGEVPLVVGTLSLVLVIWFLIHKLRYESLGNIELVMRIYADLEGAVERLIERVAEEEAPRRAAASSKNQTLM